MNASLRRTTGLARANGILMVRNRLTFAYALVFPLLPLGLLFAVDRNDIDSAMAICGSALLVAMLFPVFYNLLSIVVSRRDELVLKRLRTGETKDHEQLVAMGLPGAAIAMVIAVLMLVIGLAVGLPAPKSPLLYFVAMVLGTVTFSALAIWTAAWTRNAEAAQLTSVPVIMVTVVGLQQAAFPERWQPYIGATPGAALDRLMRSTWFGRGPDGMVEPVLILVAWTVLGVALAHRSMRWEVR